MIKIKYPEGVDRTTFENEYKAIWGTELDARNQRLNDLLDSEKKYLKLRTYSFEDILLAPFEKLETIAREYRAVTFTDQDIHTLKSIFHYDYKTNKLGSFGSKYSVKIASFF